MSLGGSGIIIEDFFYLEKRPSELVGDVAEWSTERSNGCFQTSISSFLPTFCMKLTQISK